jgi:DNA-directed RNA polymerase subunit N (RpoN/RPB10)
MIIPVKCFTCGNVLADKYRYYLEEVRRIKISQGLQVENVVYLTKKNNSLDEIREIEKSIPVKRLAEAKEIAELCYLLGSPLNTYINGQTLVVDGGYSCR